MTTDGTPSQALRERLVALKRGDTVKAVRGIRMDKLVAYQHGFDDGLDAAIAALGELDPGPQEAREPDLKGVVVVELAAEITDQFRHLAKTAGPDQWARQEWLEQLLSNATQWVPVEAADPDLLALAEKWERNEHPYKDFNASIYYDGSDSVEKTRLTCAAELRAYLAQKEGR